MTARTLLRTAALFLLAALIAMPAQVANAQKETKKVEKKVRVMKKDADHDSEHNIWFGDDDVEKEITVTVDDGRRIIVVNGDTVSVDECDPDCEDPPFMVKEFDGPSHRKMMWHSDDDSPFGYLFGELADRDGALFLPDMDIDIDIPHLDIFRFHDQEIREMERKSRDLARKARKAEGDEKVALEKELEDVLEEIFDKKQENSEERIAELTERLEENKMRVQKRSAERERIIEKRKNELLGEHDYMEW